MKICLLADASSVHTQKWARYFSSQGNDVSIVTFLPTEEIDYAKIYPVRIGRINTNGGNWNYLFKVLKVAKIIKTINPDILNAHYLTSYGLVGSLVNIKPFVASAWGSDILVTPQRSILYKLITKYVLSKASLITSDSEFMSSKIIEFGIDENKILTVAMGIDTKIFNQEGRDFWSTKEEGLTILSLRRLDTNFNIETIIEGFNIVCKQKISAKLVIANIGEEEDGLLELVQRLNLQDKVKFIGLISHKSVAEYLKKADIYISIPNFDATSVTLLEAIACGLFPIVSDIPANNEWVINGQNGFLVLQNNPEHLANKMIAAIKDADLRRRAAKLNWELIGKRALLEDCMAMIEAKYKSLII